jgi:hypothetical protein
MLSRPLRILVICGLLVSSIGWIRDVMRPTPEAMISAAATFLKSLPDDARQTAMIPYDSSKRVDWHFIPKAERKGLQIKHMNAEQRKAALALLQSGLSEIGYDKATTIMTLEGILHELEKSKAGGAIRDPDRYYVTVFGQPGDKGRWGWSVEGHHLSLNFAVNDGKVSSTTPTFFGSNPAEVKDGYGVGPKQGTRVLRKEEDLGFELVRSLDADQRKQAIIAEKAPGDIRGPADAQPPADENVGIPASKLNEGQRKRLWSLIEAYAANMPADVANDRLEAIKSAGIEKLQFAWAGAEKPGVGHYYRVEGPTFLIEFVNVQPDSAGNQANHIHSVWRSREGDFALAP